MSTANEILALDLARHFDDGERVTYNQNVAGAHHQAPAVWALAQRNGARRKAGVGGITFRVLLVAEPRKRRMPVPSGSSWCLPTDS